LLIELREAGRKRRNAMASQILDTSNSAERLSFQYAENIARLARLFAFAIAVFLPFSFLVAFALTRPDFNRQEIPHWRPVLALAEASAAKGELYDARSLYSRAAQLASWREDWGGLLVAACGMKLLDNSSGPYFNVHTTLVRAMMAGESRQSRAGIVAVARAFAAMGNDEAASMALGRIQTDWPEEMHDSTNAHAGSCW
jgi:hypothetical protein